MAVMEIPTPCRRRPTTVAAREGSRGRKGAGPRRRYATILEEVPTSKRRSWWRPRSRRIPVRGVRVV